MFETKDFFLSIERTGYENIGVNSSCDQHDVEQITIYNDQTLALLKGTNKENFFLSYDCFAIFKRSNDEWSKMQLNDASFDDGRGGSFNFRKMIVINRRNESDILVYWSHDFDSPSEFNPILFDFALKMRFGSLIETNAGDYIFEEMFEYRKQASAKEVMSLDAFPAIVPYVETQGAIIAATLISPFEMSEENFPISYDIHEFYVQNETFEIETSTIYIDKEMIGASYSDSLELTDRLRIIV